MTGILPIAVAVAAVALAAPAAATDQDDYLRPLLTKDAELSSQQLLTESSRICSTILAGNSAAIPVPMVQKDLGGVSVAEASDVISAAVAYRHC
jgi:hypothetical protein